MKKYLWILEACFSVVGGNVQADDLLEWKTGELHFRDDTDQKGGLGFNRLALTVLLSNTSYH